ncbi:MAG: 23S rRNA (adenine(2503)-C(2))-methyltransferase RlmN [SAR324 cluster bacterium]|nr:23S rRNA (adenine(2503)-C(2))-methyltransferase RlmN [SAR324 cluster bacterium]
MSNLKNIKDFPLPDLTDWFVTHEEKPFRAKQVFNWLYQKRVEEFGEMKNMSKALRQKLQQHFFISDLTRAREARSKDGSIKYVFELRDGKRVESVLMPHRDHYTVCVSSQVGCAMGCDFCMTAKMGLIRNLTPGEILDQILEMWKDLPQGEVIRNVVFMGMGEPFHNYDNLMRTLEIMLEDVGFNFSSRRITVSTSGLVPQIIRFGKETVKANLAISLNGVNDGVRTQLMPINKAYDLEKLIASCQAYPLESRKRITFEYILMRDVTDALDDAKRLIKILHGLKFKINLIPYNDSPGSKYKRPSWDRIQQFQNYLLEHGVTATLRISKGQDIQGACGQLITGTKIDPEKTLPAAIPSP